MSNHGGRELDLSAFFDILNGSPLFTVILFCSSPAPITILHELRQLRPDILDDPKFEVYIDGGVTRGTDVLKALCLGAKGVGLGRAFLYANALYGEEGCRRVIQSQFFLGFLSHPNLSPFEPIFIRRADLFYSLGLRLPTTVLREEIVTGMQLMGVTSLEQLKPELVKYAGSSDVARSRL